MTTTNWQTKGNNGDETSGVIDFGLVDSKGRKIGTVLCAQENKRSERGSDGVWYRIACGTFSYSIQSTRNGALFGGIPRHEGDFATIEEAKAAAEKAAERSRKAQARKYGATVEEAKAKQAADYERSLAIHRAKLAETAAWIAERKAEQAAKAAPAVEAAPAPVAEVAIEVEPAPVVKWQDVKTDDSARVARAEIDFALVDAKGRRIGTFATVQRNTATTYAYGGETKFDFGTFSYSLVATRNGLGFGAIPRKTGHFATIEEAKVAAEAAVERSRKSQARRYGASVEEAKAAVAARKEKSREKLARWWAERDAAKAQQPVAAPVVEPDPEVVRFRGYRGPDGELRFRKAEAAPAELPRCRNCGTTFDPAVEGVADVFVACGTCRHGQLEPGEEPDCACHRDPALFA